MQNLEIYCNNNNPDQNDPNNISLISRINSNDDVPAVKVLGVFFTLTLILNITFQPYKTNYLKLFMPFDPLKKP